MKKTLVVQFARYGPYHHARLRAAAIALQPAGWQVVGLETAGNDATYAWNTTKVVESDPKVVTAFARRVHEEISEAECKRVFVPLLAGMKPDAVAVAGWGTRDARTCLNWCRHHGVRAILMSETREADGWRLWWREWLKSRLIRHIEGGLVGGRSHRDYLVKLGMPAEHVCFGYNVVDNAYFRNESAQWRANDQSRGAVIHPYILASNRFVERKNLIRLVQAFSAALRTDAAGQCAAFDLCLVGDGPQRAALQSTCKALELPVVDAAPWELQGGISPAYASPRVYLPGFRQIEELPRFYAHASAFVHPAISEPWGLVINEAMASGLPLLCSSNCGASEELLEDGVNGYRFNPLTIQSISSALVAFMNLTSADRDAMGRASSELLEERLPTSAFGNGLLSLLLP